MVSGETRDDATIVGRPAVGWAMTSSGRLSASSQPGDLSETYPFSIKDRVELDDALKYGSRGVEGADRRVHR